MYIAYLADQRPATALDLSLIIIGRAVGKEITVVSIILLMAEGADNLRLN